MDSLLEKELLETLKSLILNWENEVVEFKEANNDYKNSPNKRIANWVLDKPENEEKKYPILANQGHQP